MAAWCRSNALVAINKVTLRRARLVAGWLIRSKSEWYMVTDPKEDQGRRDWATSAMNARKWTSQTNNAWNFITRHEDDTTEKHGTPSRDHDITTTAISQTVMLTQHCLEFCRRSCGSSRLRSRDAYHGECSLEAEATAPHRVCRCVWYENRSCVQWLMTRNLS